MMEKMMDPNIIDYYIINCAIASIITIENRYQIDFGKPAFDILILYYTLWGNKIDLKPSHLKIIYKPIMIAEQRPQFPAVGLLQQLKQ